MDPIDPIRPNHCAVGIGANLGDPETTIERAVNLLRMRKGLAVAAVSSIWLTEPVGGPKNQGWYCNRAVILNSELTTIQIFRLLTDIESILGRVREVKWGPRIIDLDLLFRGQEVLDLPELVVPHPLLHERGFVLNPLAEVAPGWIHPVLGQSVAEMLERLPPDGPACRML